MPPRDFRVVKFVLAPRQTRPSTRLSRSAVPISYVAASQMWICLSKSSARLTNPGDMSAVIGFWSGIKGVYGCRLTTLDAIPPILFPDLIKYNFNDFQKCDF